MVENRYHFRLFDFSSRMIIFLILLIVTNGLTVSSLAGNLTQNQGLITSCPYFTEDGHVSNISR